MLGARSLSIEQNFQIWCNMTAEEIYRMLGALLKNAVPEDFQSANLFIERLDKYVGAKGTYINMQNETRNLDDLQFALMQSTAVYELLKKTTEGDVNKWDKLSFTLYHTGKFEVDFIWDEEYHDEIDKIKQFKKAKHSV